MARDGLHVLFISLSFPLLPHSSSHIYCEIHHPVSAGTQALVPDARDLSERPPGSAASSDLLLEPQPLLRGQAVPPCLATHFLLQEASRAVGIFWVSGSCLHLLLGPDVRRLCHRLPSLFV